MLMLLCLSLAALGGFVIGCEYTARRLWRKAQQRREAQP
jgi:hypothetical protein